MRWLLLKDLRILRRSPLLTALLIAYPVVIAVLIGFALSRGPDEPRIAFVNQIPAGTPFEIGGQSIDLVGAKSELCARVECVRAGSEEEAREMVADGDVLGALILPADLLDRLRSLTGLSAEEPSVKVILNEEDPIKGQIVSDRIDALLSEANLQISRRVSDVASTYMGILLDGGDFSFVGSGLTVLGLRPAERVLRAVREQLPAGSPQLEKLDEVIRFSHLAAENLGAADDLLSSVSRPIRIDKERVNGASPSLDSFAIAVAATVTLMFVTLLLVAGSLALEREENAFSRLTRGLIGVATLLAEKVLLGVVAALAVTLLLLAGVSAFVPLDWGRAPLWLAAIVAGGAAFAACGAAFGALAKEVRAASLLAFMVGLPLAFLALVPSGSVSDALFDVISVAGALFPFDPALRALQGALDVSGPAVGVAIGHLAVLALAYGLLARFAARRLAT